MAAETLLKPDRLTLALEALKDGKIVARATSWDDNKTILASQYLELRNRAGQINVIRVDTGAGPAAALLTDQKAVGRIAERLFDVSALTGSVEIDGIAAARHTS